MARPKKRTQVELKRAAMVQTVQRILAGEYITAEKLALEFGRSVATTALWLREAKSLAEKELSEKDIESVGIDQWKPFREKLVTRAISRLQKLERLADVAISNKEGSEGLKLSEGCIKLMGMIDQLTAEVKRESQAQASDEATDITKGAGQVQFAL